MTDFYKLNLKYSNLKKKEIDMSANNQHINEAEDALNLNPPKNTLSDKLIEESERKLVVENEKSVILRRLDEIDNRLKYVESLTSGFRKLESNLDKTGIAERNVLRPMVETILRERTIKNDQP